MSAVPQDRYWLDARDKLGLLTHMMRFLAGQARISFEGNLSHCKFPPMIPIATEQDSILTRQTAMPRMDFIILPLEQDTIRLILDAVVPADRYMVDIIHIQIEKRGELQFGSYDNFHPECIVSFRGVTMEFLDEFKHTGVIRSWTKPFEGARRWHG